MSGIGSMDFQVFLFRYGKISSNNGIFFAFGTQEKDGISIFFIPE